MDSRLNNDSLDFRLLPNDCTQIDFEKDRYFLNELYRKSHSVYYYLHEGIRTVNRNDYHGLICVICDVKLQDISSANVHIKKNHKDVGELLKNTPLKPVVGLDYIDMLKDNKRSIHDVLEYHCNLCDLKLNGSDNKYATKISGIFWHVLSDYHKEQYFKKEYPNDSINKIADPKLRREKMDNVLIKVNPGSMKKKNYKHGLITSVGYRHTLNISYIKKFYPQETVRVERISSINMNLKNKIDLFLFVKIYNDEQFDKSKELLQRINQSISKYLMKYEK